MAIDTSMYGNIQPLKLDSPLNALAQVSQIQGAQNQNRLADYTIAKAQRADADEMEVRNALMGNKGDYAGAQSTLMSKGLYKPAMEIGKANLEQKKTESEIGKNTAESGAKNFEVSDKKRKQAISDIAGFDTPEQALASLEAHAAAGDVDPKQAEVIKTALSQAPNFREWQVGMIKNILDAKDRMKYTSPDADTLANNATSIQTTGMNNATSVKTTGMNNATSIKTTGMNNATSRANTADTVAAQLSTPHYMETEDGIVALPKKLASGQAPIGTPAVGADGKPLQKKQNVPQYVVEGLAHNERTKSVIQSALASLQTPEGKNAVGMKAMLPQAIVNKLDPKGINTRADISDIGSMTVKDRSGATVTIAEEPRLMPFIPSASDDDKTVTKKLTRMLQILEADGQALTAFHPGAQKGLSKIQNKGASPGAASAPSGWSIEEVK